MPSKPLGERPSERPDERKARRWDAVKSLGVALAGGAVVGGLTWSLMSNRHHPVEEPEVPKELFAFRDSIHVEPDGSKFRVRANLSLLPGGYVAKARIRVGEMGPAEVSLHVTESTFERGFRTHAYAPGRPERPNVPLAVLFGDTPEPKTIEIRANRDGGPTLGFRLYSQTHTPEFSTQTTNGVDVLIEKGAQVDPAGLDEATRTMASLASVFPPGKPLPRLLLTRHIAPPEGVVGYNWMYMQPELAQFFEPLSPTQRGHLYMHTGALTKENVSSSFHECVHALDDAQIGTPEHAAFHEFLSTDEDVQAAQKLATKKLPSSGDASYDEFLRKENHPFYSFFDESTILAQPNNRGHPYDDRKEFFASGAACLKGGAAGLQARFQKLRSENPGEDFAHLTAAERFTLARAVVKSYRQIASRFGEHAPALFTPQLLDFLKTQAKQLNVELK